MALACIGIEVGDIDIFEIRPKNPQVCLESLDLREIYCKLDAGKILERNCEQSDSSCGRGKHSRATISLKITSFCKSIISIGAFLIEATRRAPFATESKLFTIPRIPTVIDNGSILLG